MRKVIVIVIIGFFIGAGIVPGINSNINQIDEVEKISSSSSMISLTDGLVGYWSFNEKQGNIAFDGSGMGNDGIIHNATYGNGISGSALQFDFNDDDYVLVPDDDSLNLSNALTIGVWIKSFDTEGARTIVSKWNDQTWNHSFIFKDYNWGDHLHIELSKGHHNDLADLDGNTSIVLNEWIYAATTFDSNTVKLYYNGKLDSSKEAIGTISKSCTDVIIGGMNYRDGTIKENFHGYIDEVRIYNRTLSEAEIQYLYDHPDGENQPPDKPSIEGQTSGKVGEEYQYFCKFDDTADTDGNPVFYWWDWGDGNNSRWLGPYNPTDHIYFNHTWSEKGRYNIKVKLKDVIGAESEWSDPFSITMPKSYNKLIPQFLDLLFKRVPLPISKTWMKNFGGMKDDYGRSVQQTSDGGYIIVGYTGSFGAGSWDFWLIKTDSNGNEEWNRTFGGTKEDYGFSVQQTTDGGYIITGTTFSFGFGESDVWLIKTDSNGYKLWDKTFGNDGYQDGRSVKQTIDGGYIITGLTQYTSDFGKDVWLIKTDSNGKEIWNKTFGGSKQDAGFSVQQTTDGGYIIAGYTNASDISGFDVWLIKTDSNGNKIWDTIFKRTDDDYANSVQQTTDGGYIMVGVTAKNSSLDPQTTGDIWLIKTDGNGNKMWDKTFGGTGYEEGFSISNTNDGGNIIVGVTSSFGAGEYDVWLIKIDSSGNEEWNRTLGGTRLDIGFSVQQTTDGGYIIVGDNCSFNNPYSATPWDVLLIKTDSQGKSKTISSGNYWLEKLFQRFPFFERILNLYYN